MTDNQQDPQLSDDQAQQKNSDSPLDLLEDVLEEARGAVSAKEKLAQAKEKQAVAQAAEQAKLSAIQQQQATLDQEKIAQQKQKMASVTQAAETQRQKIAEAHAEKVGASTEPDEADYEIQQLEHSEITVPEEKSEA